MKKKALAALCLAGLTATQICVAGGNSNWSGSEKYQPPAEDKTQVETTTSADNTTGVTSEAATPADLAANKQAAKAKDKKAQKDAAAKKQALPVILTCDKADYDPETGDFEAQGNVKMVQGLETLHSVRLWVMCVPVMSGLKKAEL